MSDAEGLRNRARACTRRGRFAEAEAALRDALALGADLATFIDLGITLKRLRKTADAEAVFADAVRHHPRSASALVELGVARFELGRYADAVLALRAAVGVRPDFARAYLCLGLALERRGEYGAAEAALREGQ